MDSMFIGAESSASIFLILCSRAVFKQFNALYFFKNDRPGDDGTLRSVQLLVFLVGVIDLASTSA